MNIINIKLIELNPSLLFIKCKSLSDYQKKRRECMKCYSVLQNIIKNQKEIDIEAHCAYCKKKTKLRVDFEYAWKSDDGKLIPNLRERLVCEKCGLNSRMRAIYHLLSVLCGDISKKKIYITEELTPMFDLLKRKNRSLIGSEFVPEKKMGTFVKLDDTGKIINNQDLTNLTFPDSEFDIVLSLDVLEHIPDYKKALGEIYRVLKDDSYFIFSVPFYMHSEKNTVRAKIENNAIINILSPEYHGDPVTKKGCLCFYYFGWEIMKELTDIGFKESGAYINQSIDFGYLNEGIIFYAKK